MDKTGGNHLDRTVKYKIEKAKKNVVTTALKIKRSRKEETKKKCGRRKARRLWSSVKPSKDTFNEGEIQNVQSCYAGELEEV